MYKRQGKDIVLKKTQKGRKYYGCIGNPECDFMVWQRPSNEKCPVCGSILLEKGNKLVCSKEGCGFVKEKMCIRDRHSLGGRGEASIGHSRFLWAAGGGLRSGAVRGTGRTI